MIEYWNDDMEFFRDKLYYDFNMKLSDILLMIMKRELKRI